MKFLICADLFFVSCGKHSCQIPALRFPVVYGGGNRAAYRPFSGETTFSAFRRLRVLPASL